MLRRLLYKLKLLVRSRSWHFTQDTLKQRRSIDLATINWRGQKIHYRPGTSDGAMIYDTLMKSQYYVPTALEPQVILDIGSNIGGSIIYFRHQFPSARIYGFEPHPETFQVLQRNVSNLPSVSVFNFGLGNSDRELAIPFQNGDFKSFRTTQPSTSPPDVPLVQCKVRNVATVLSELGIGKVDLIKIDCEGAEYDILTAIPRSILAGCKWIVGEIHDEQGFELLAFLASQFELDLQKQMFRSRFVFHACNKEIIPQVKGTFRPSRLRH